MTEELTWRREPEAPVAPASVGRIVASEAAAVSELAPEPVPEVEAVLPTEVAAFEGLAPDDVVEARASLRVLLAEHDPAHLEATEGQDDALAGATDTLRRLATEAHLAES